jgi:DNA-binding NarL/FixJ family response regulator
VSELTKEISCALLAEPHHSLAEGTRLLLATLFDTVVMLGDDGSLVEIAERVRPRIVILDLVLAKRNLPELISRLRESFPAARVLVVSVHEERSAVRAVREAGADGFIVKGRIGSELIAAVETVLRGDRYFSRDIEQNV